MIASGGYVGLIHVISATLAVAGAALFLASRASLHDALANIAAEIIGLAGGVVLTVYFVERQMRAEADDRARRDARRRVRLTAALLAEAVADTQGIAASLNPEISALRMPRGSIKEERTDLAHAYSWIRARPEIPDAMTSELRTFAAGLFSDLAPRAEYLGDAATYPDVEQDLVQAQAAWLNVDVDFLMAVEVTWRVLDAVYSAMLAAEPRGRRTRPP